MNSQLFAFIGDAEDEELVSDPREIEYSFRETYLDTYGNNLYYNCLYAIVKDTIVILGSKFTEAKIIKDFIGYYGNTLLNKAVNRCLAEVTDTFGGIRSECTTTLSELKEAGLIVPDTGVDPLFSIEDSNDILFNTNRIMEYNLPLSIAREYLSVAYNTDNAKIETTFANRKANILSSWMNCKIKPFSNIWMSPISGYRWFDIRSEKTESIDPNWNHILFVKLNT